MRSSIKGISPEWYTLSIDKDEDDPVKFYIKPLDGLTWPQVLLESYNAETGEIGGLGVIKAFRLGVRNWCNIEDADNPGEQLAFSMQAMRKLSPGWIMEVGNHVLEISRISAGESKNSASPSSSQKT